MGMVIVKLEKEIKKLQEDNKRLRDHSSELEIKLLEEDNDELCELQEENQQLQNRIDELEKYEEMFFTLNSWIQTQDEEAEKKINAFNKKFKGASQVTISPDGFKAPGISISAGEYNFHADDVPVGGLKEEE